MEVPLYQRKNVSLCDCLALYQGPVLTYSCLFENGNCFLRFQKKKIRVHTLRSWMVCPSKKNAIAIENGTSFDENMRINWYPSPWRHRFSWTSVSIHPHEYSKTASSKISTLESVLENTRFRWPFLPDTCKRQAKLEGKNPFSNKNLHVDGTKASLLFFMRFPEKNSNTPLSNNKKSFSSWHACRRTSYKAWNFHGIIR